MLCRFLYRVGGIRHRIAFSGAVQHADIIIIIPKGHGFLFCNSQPFLDTGQSRAFIRIHPHKIHPGGSGSHHIQPACKFFSCQNCPLLRMSAAVHRDLHNRLLHLQDILHLKHFNFIALAQLPDKGRIPAVCVSHPRRRDERKAALQGADVPDRLRCRFRVNGGMLHFSSLFDHISSVFRDKNNIIFDRAQNFQHTGILPSACRGKQDSPPVQFL